MDHLVFDINVILDVLLNREGCAPAEQLFEYLQSGRCQGWVAASSLPIIEYLLRRELKASGATLAEVGELTASLLNWLGQQLKPLSLPGLESMDYCGKAKDFEDAQIALSALALGNAAVIVSNDRNFDTLDQIPVLAPAACLEKLAKGINEVKEAVPFIDLQEHQRQLLPELEGRIRTVLRHGRYILGPEVGELEARLADYVSAKHCIAVSSGTDALLIAMMALGIGLGDEVITTPFTFIATAGMITLLGAKPVFVDIDPRTYHIDPHKIEAVITANTKAILPVNLYGQCADFDAINAIAEKHGLAVIEDAAQSFGATYKGRKSCALSTIGCTSFFPSKPLGCYGDGGACFTEDETLARRMRQIRIHGQDRRYHHPLIGVNGRLDTLQAAILLAKLDAFPTEIRRRAAIGARYTELLNGDGVFPLGVRGWIITPYIESHNTSVYAQYTVQVEARDKLIANLQRRGIPTAVHYPVPLSLQPAFAGFDQPAGSFPVAEAASRKVLSLPMHPYLSEAEQTRIVGLLLDTWKSPEYAWVTG